MRRVLAEIATFALFAALAVVMTWPLAANLGSAVPDHTDAYWSAFVMRWDAHALTSPARLFDLPIFHPHRNALAFSESLLGIAIPMLPLYLAGVEPLTVYNIALLFGFALAGYGAFVLCRTATGSHAAAFAGGVFFAFLPYRFHHMAQIQYVSAGWLALMLAAWLYWTASPTRGRAALFGAAFFVNGLACLHWLVLGGLAVAFAAPVAMAIQRPLQKPRAWLALAIATAIACLALAPLLRPYIEVRRANGMERAIDDTLRYSARLADWLVPPFHTPYASLLNDGSADPERWLFPGVFATALAVAGMGSARKRWSVGRLVRWSVGIAAVALLALAWVRAMAVVPLRLDLVSRSIDFSGSAVVPLVAGVVLLILLIPRRLAPTLPLVTAEVWILCGLMLASGPANPFFRLLFRFVSPLRGIRAPTRWSMIVFAGMAILIAAFVARFRRRGLAAAACSVLMLAEVWVPNRFVQAASPSATTRWLAKARFRGGVFETPFRTNGSDYRYMLAAATHLKPLLNGVSSFEPADRDQLEHADAAMLKEMDATLVIDHGRDRGNLCTDQISVLDPARIEWLPPMICDTPAATVVSPTPNADVRGPLTIRVNTTAKNIRARLGSGRVVVALTNGVATIAERPASLARDTDIQIEIDGTRLEGTFLTWRRRSELVWYDWRPPATWEIARRLGAPDQLGRDLLTSRAPANLLVRATLAAGRGLDDAAFPDFATAALIGHRISLQAPSREALVRKIIETDEFARGNLR